MAMKNNQFFQRFYLIFLQVFIISILIIIVYLGYNLTYLKYLLESNKKRRIFFLKKQLQYISSVQKGFFIYFFII